MKKKIIVLLLAVSVSVPFTGCGNKEISQSEGISQSDYDAIVKEKEDLQNTLDSTEKELSDLQTKYEAYKEKMKPFEEMEAAEAEQKAAEAKAASEEAERQKAAKEAVDKIWNFTDGVLADGATRELYNDALAKVNKLTDETQKASMMQAVQAADALLSAQEQAAAEEEAKGYETGITYDQLARTPDDFTLKKVKFSGKVLQVIEGDDSVQIRLAVNNNYDTVLLGEYSSSIVSSRILEDDQITIYGTSVGTISYESTGGGKITIPGVYIDKIDQ